MDKCKNWQDAIPLKRELYELHGAGGLAHIVINDGNLDTHFIERCLELCRTDAFCTWEVRRASQELLSVMLTMSLTQRRKLYRHGGDQ